MLVNFPPNPPETQSFGQVPNGRGPEWWVVSPPTPSRAATVLASSWNALRREGGADGFPPNPPETQSFGQVPSGRGPEWWVVSPPTPSTPTEVALQPFGSGEREVRSLVKHMKASRRKRGYFLRNGFTTRFVPS